MRPLVNRNLNTQLSPADIILSTTGTRRLEAVFFNGDTVSRKVIVLSFFGDGIPRQIGSITIPANSTGMVIAGEGTTPQTSSATIIALPLTSGMRFSFDVAASIGWLYEVTQWFQDY